MNKLKDMYIWRNGENVLLRIEFEGGYKLDIVVYSGQLLDLIQSGVRLKKEEEAQ